MRIRSSSNVHWRAFGIPLVGEGLTMACCAVPSLYYGDGMLLPIVGSAALTLLAGVVLLELGRRGVRMALLGGRLHDDQRMSYVTVTLLWLLLSLFGMLPFLLTGSVGSVTDALFESMSGLTSTGATVFPDVELLPPSVLLWRSMSQWVGGFGIVLLVLAIVPRLRLNKYSLYTAEASGADNTGKTTTSMRTTVRRTLLIYTTLTLLFIILLRIAGMTLWEAVNMTFTNISTGGFSIYADSVARFTPVQQYLLTASMFVGGVNFALLYSLLTFKWRSVRHKMDQFGFYVAVCLSGIVFVAAVLFYHDGYSSADAIRCAVVQTISVVTTTGSVVADTNLWWTPVLFLFLLLGICGGMAGSTTGGVKVMRVLIMLRGVRNSMLSRLHPHAYNPVRLNGKPVSEEMVSNVMVIFFVYAATMLVAVLLLLVCGVDATESLGAVIGCLSGYGPGLGLCGGFGSYVAFPVAAKWVCSVLMLLGRLECLTVLILFMPGFWRR